MLTGGQPRVQNLVVTLPQTSADSFHAWYQDFVVKGDNSKLKTGTLNLLSPTGTVLATVAFTGLGIVKYQVSSKEVNGVRLVRVEMPAQSAVLTFNGA